MTVLIEVVRGDLTRLEVDAVVNAANEDLRPGGGVCGALHAAAGPELASACRVVAPCPTGEARVTPGFGLPAGWVIHAVGPVWRGGGEGEAALLAACYRAALREVAELGIESVAFPAISTGIFGYPLESACRIAVSACRAFAATNTHPIRIVLCAFDDRTEAALRTALG